MQLSRDAPPDANLISGLDDSGLRIRGQVYTTSLIVSPARVITDWPVGSAGALRAKDWQSVIELEPAIVLFGSGRALHFPDSAALAPLLTRGIGIEVMDTAAACRTYNLLLTEGRPVVAALVLDEPDKDG